MTTWSTFFFLSSKNIFAKKKVRRKDVITLVKQNNIHAKRMKIWSTFLCESSENIFIKKKLDKLLLFRLRIIPKKLRQQCHNFGYDRYYSSCARIDNNRREYWQKKVAKDGVHACVLRIFFLRCAFLLSSVYNVVDPSNKTPVAVHWQTTCGDFVLLEGWCARIDNNRREYREEDERKMVYMHVCSAFFFSLRSFY